jgi:NAD(P)-dependent dehydrogenase (short-subunit alcohol dehydrogenase family)
MTAEPGPNNRSGTTIAIGCRCRRNQIRRGAELCQAALHTYGAIDCFFNNAGIEVKVAPTAEPAIGGAVIQAMQS